MDVRMTLACAGAVTLNTLADIADKVAEYATPTIYTMEYLVTSPPSIEERLQQLSDVLNALQLSSTALGG